MTSGPEQGPSERSPEWDEGVASERTVLAWERTAVASAAVAALILRAGIVEHLLGVAIPVATLLLAAGAAEWLFSRRIYQERDRPFAQGAVVHDRAILAVGAVTLVAAAASVALALGA